MLEASISLVMAHSRSGEAVVFREWRELATCFGTELEN